MTLSELAAEMRRTVDAGVFNGQIVLHVANGEVVKVEATTVAKVRNVVAIVTDKTTFTIGSDSAT